VQFAIRTLLEIGSIASVITIACWIGMYTYLEPWWTGRVGRSLVYFAFLAMVTPILFILSLFWHLNRGTSQGLAWVEVALLVALIPLGMLRRIWVWWIVSKSGETGHLPAGKETNSQGGDGHDCTSS